MTRLSCQNIVGLKVEFVASSLPAISKNVPIPKTKTSLHHCGLAMSIRAVLKCTILEFSYSTIELIRDDDTF